MTAPVLRSASTPPQEPRGDQRRDHQELEGGQHVRVHRDGAAETGLERVHQHGLGKEAFDGLGHDG
ncbi:MAG: hypothetical protein IPG81_09415 [Sandaracinaceae bacterium]|nr:hypothetical protein [Sandaracinaceae bacterium]